MPVPVRAPRAPVSMAPVPGGRDGRMRRRAEMPAPGANFKVSPGAEKAKARAGAAKVAAASKVVGVKVAAVAASRAAGADLDRRSVPARMIRLTIRAARPSSR